MITFQLQIIAIACLVSIATALPGVFLVLRGVALMSDAISHAILLGIIGMFLLVQRLDSPLLLIGAALAGLLTVVVTEMLIQTQRLKKDAAIGLVFPLFFSIGVILISQYARNVHLDTDMVLLGELAFAPFNRLMIYGVDVGPHALWLMSGIVLINSLAVALFYKELQLATFDPCLAYVLGFSPTVMYYGLMTLTSITAVGAFDAVGSIVVVALMITPAATAYLLVEQVAPLLILSVVIGMSSALGGYVLANQLDVSIAGAIAVMTGIIFMFALFGAPRNGIIARYIIERRRRRVLAQDVLCAYVMHLNHKGASKEYYRVAVIAQQLGWTQNFMQQVIALVVEQGVMQNKENVLVLAEDEAPRHTLLNDV